MFNKELKARIAILEAELQQALNDKDALQKEVDELKDDSGDAVLEKLAKLAKKSGLNPHSEEYQQMMSRAFLDIAGRTLPIMKGYSQAAFMKDNPDEVLKRVIDFKKELSVITKQLEDKSGKEKK